MLLPLMLKMFRSYSMGVEKNTRNEEALVNSVLAR